MDTMRRLWEQYRYLAFGALFVSVFGLGLIGWRLTEPMSIWEAAYRSLGLFVLEGSARGDIAVPLNIARFAAPLTTSWAVIALAARIIRSHSTLTRASRARQHTVVLGSSHEAASIAQGFRGQEAAGKKRQVVSIGTLDAADEVQLARAGVLHLTAVDDHLLARILRDAQHVVIAEDHDRDAAAASHKVRSLSPDPDLSVLTLFDNRELSGDWVQSRADVVVCRPALIASAVLRQVAPFAEDSLTPSPVVLGDGLLATEITRGIIGGWQQPGETLTVHCGGPDRGWADAAVVGLDGRGTIDWQAMTPHAHLAPRTVRWALGAWQSPSKAERYRSHAATVYVAFDDDTDGVPIAMSIAHRLGDSVHVVVAVDDVSAWRGNNSGRGPNFLGKRELLSDPDHLCRGSAARLADEIVADLGRWPDDVATVFGRVERAQGQTATLGAQSEEMRAAIVRVASAIEETMATAGLTIVDDQGGPAAAVVLDPAELSAVAHEIGRLVPDPDGQPSERWVRQLELASRLPTLLLRTGRMPRRPGERRDTLNADNVSFLARCVHSGYLQVAQQTANATGSVHAATPWERLPDTEQRSNVAQVLDIPVKLAMADLTYAAVEHPRRYLFDPEDAELLSEQEHRRWAHFEMRNGRHGHAWNKPWAEIDPSAQQYDRDAVALIPRLLAHIGLEIVPLDPAAEPRGGYLPPAPERKAEPQRYRRRGRAWAWPLTAPHTWRTGRGDRLVARAGDWWVITEDGSPRSVSPAAFAATYQHVAGPEFARIGTVTARQVRQRETVTTREGMATAEVGDWLVSDDEGHTWPVSGRVFDQLYGPEV